jgi:hypothetical protein
MMAPLKTVSLEQRQWDAVYESLKQCADDLADQELEDIAEAIKAQLLR